MSSLGFSIGGGGGGGGSSGFSLGGSAPIIGGTSISKKRSLFGEIAHDIVALPEHLASDIGTSAINLLPGLYEVGKTAIENPSDLGKLAKGIVKQYEDYYGHDVLHHLYEHPLQPILDGLTLVSGGLGGAAKLGELANIERFASLSKRAEIVTRSPKTALGEAGPTYTRLTSNKPIVRARQLAQHKVSRAIDDFVQVRRGATGPGPFEARAAGREIQRRAHQQAMRDITPLFPHERAWRKLNENERVALQALQFDIHPNELKEFWHEMGGTQNAEDITPEVAQLMIDPSPRMKLAEPLLRHLSESGAGLYERKGMLSAESKADRPGRFKEQVAQVIGRPTTDLHGDPFYIPHTIEPARGSSPMQMVGGGKAEPLRPGTTKQNLGELFAAGKLDLHNDILGPEFSRRVKWLKFHAIHQGLKRGAIRLTWDDLHRDYGGRAPKGYVFMRTSVPQRASQKLLSEINRLEKIKEKRPSTKIDARLKDLYARRAEHFLGEDPYVGFTKQKIPFSIRAEGQTPLHELIPDPQAVERSPLAEHGFTTDNPRDPNVLQDESKRFYLVPKSTAKAATGEFTRMSDFMYRFGRQPVRVWRALILGLRPAFLVNNLIGNNLMYGMRVGGTRGAGRDLFRAFYETIGARRARKLLDDGSTPPELKDDVLREFYPEQHQQGTFGYTQSPATEAGPLRGATTKLGRGWAKGTGFLPHITSILAEEAPRRALLTNTIRRSPEFRAVYRSLPRETRNFDTAARLLHEGKGGREFQRLISDQVDRAIGNYTHLNPFERNVMRTALPFYSWYRAILTTSLHLALDNPLRAQIMVKLGQIGAETQLLHMAVPSFLQGSLPLGSGPNGTQRALATQTLNPWATLGQLSRGLTTDITQLGLDPYFIGTLQAFGKLSSQFGQTQAVSPGALLGAVLKDIGMGVPPLAQLFPRGPSQLYPNRGAGNYLQAHESALLSWLGVPIKEYNPYIAAQQAAQGR